MKAKRRNEIKLSVIAVKIYVFRVSFCKVKNINPAHR